MDEILISYHLFAGNLTNFLNCKIDDRVIVPLGTSDTEIEGVIKSIKLVPTENLPVSIIDMKAYCKRV